MFFGGDKNGKRPIVPRRSECKPGDIIGGKYRVEAVLGEGAFGCVYKVLDAAKTLWALKLLRLWDVPADIRQQLVDRFEMEFNTGHIASRNLVHSVDYGYQNGNPFIVMEFCNGGDLSAKIADRNADMVRYARDVLNGLGDLHREGKVHRDLKPENVLLKSDGTAALTDFGISGDRNKRMTERNIFGKPYQIFGTYAYMPPEQVNRGKATVLPTTDIFSFGVVMYQLLTGVLPFGKLDDQNDLVRYQKRGAAGDWDRDSLNRAPNGTKWAALIDGCLKPNYKNRLQSVHEALSLVPGDIPTASPLFSVQSTPKLVGRHNQLKVMQGVEFGKIYNIDEIIDQNRHPLITIGREESNTIQLPEYDEPYISRRHFTMERNANGNWLVRDGQWNVEQRSWNPSLNGTFVNSTEVPMNGVILSNGDIISVGEIKLKFEIV